MFSAAAFPASPYAGQQEREIKSLSVQEIGDYLAGKGMGLAKAAELNGYPGPAHALELADQLALTVEQRKQTEALFKDMQAKAIAAGERYIGEERMLNRLFTMKTISVTTLQAALARVAAQQSQVRLTHLEAHLTQVAILTPEQIAQYNELRGYLNPGGQATHQHVGH
ncbi:MAG: Spy/CpxP family protein refolding chaperone [Burkholderiales bacterium]|nr:Spy/CpxP family protein refolding chaperone [Burkholderiales bacterium]